MPKWDGLRGYAFYNSESKELIVNYSKGVKAFKLSTDKLIQSLVLQVEILNDNGKEFPVIVEVLKVKNLCDYSCNYHEVAHTVTKEYFIKDAIDTNTDDAYISVPIEESVKFFELLNESTSAHDDVFFTTVIKLEKEIS